MIHCRLNTKKSIQHVLKNHSKWSPKPPKMAPGTAQEAPGRLLGSLEPGQDEF